MFGRFGQRRAREEFEVQALPHHDALYATALRLTKNDRDAEDLVQDALLRGFRFFHRFEAGTNCKAWLFKILTNTFNTAYRARVREREVVAELEAEQSVAEQGDHDEALDGGSPEGALLRRMLSDDVQRALDAVPHDFRMAVLLADLEGFSYKEIADIMECPVGTVMSRLYRGRRLLQRALRRYAVDEGIIQASQGSNVVPLRRERSS
jgi:RNA polymerase sigma-70 factor, ECF subfamily